MTIHFRQPRPATAKDRRRRLHLPKPEERRLVHRLEHHQVVAATGELLTPPTMSTLLPESLSVENRQQFGRWLVKPVSLALGVMRIEFLSRIEKYSCQRLTSKHKWNLWLLTLWTRGDGALRSTKAFTAACRTPKHLIN